MSTNVIPKHFVDFSILNDVKVREVYVPPRAKNTFPALVAPWPTVLPLTVKELIANVPEVTLPKN